MNRSDLVNQSLRSSGRSEKMGLAEELNLSKMTRAKKRQVHFQQELQTSFENSIGLSFLSKKSSSQQQSEFALKNNLDQSAANQSMQASERSFLSIPKMPGQEKPAQISMISSSSHARQMRSDEPPELILDDDDFLSVDIKENEAAKLDARRDTGTVEDDLLIEEVPIQLPGILQPNLIKTKSHQPKGGVAASKDFTNIRGSVSIRKGDLNNISTDVLNPKLTMQGQTINKVTMRLPIFKILQAQVIEKYQGKASDKKEEQALVALKLSKASKGASAEKLYKIGYENKVNPNAGLKYLQDQNKEIIRTVGKEPYPYNIALFDDNIVTQKDRNINEQIFDQLKLEESIWDCCKNGKNLTVFSMEDTGKKNGVSLMLNGRSKQQTNDEMLTESEKRPGVIRMTVESIFAHIFLNRGSEFVLRMSYVEINNEMMYDLLQDGRPIGSSEELSEVNCQNIEETMSLQAKGLQNRLQSLLGGNRRDNTFFWESTLVLRFTIENLSRERVADYEMLLDEEDLSQIKVCKSQIHFVDLPELFKQENIQDQITKLKSSQLGQDTTLFAIENFIKANVDIRQASEAAQKNGEPKLELDPVIESGSSTDRNRSLAARLSSIEKYKITGLLRNQLIEGNSKMVFLFSMSPEQNSGNVSMLLQMATEAALVYQTSVETNEISTEESHLIRLKDQIEQKERQISSIEFQMKQAQESQARQGAPNFKERRSLTPKKKGDNERRPTMLQSKTQEELDQQHMKVQKLRVMNQINSLNKQILRQEGVAMFMRQFEVNRGTRRVSRILRTPDNAGNVKASIDDASSMRKSTYVDRMSRRLVSAKAYLEEDKSRVGHINSSDIRASGQIDFSQFKTQQGLEDRIAEFVRMSVKAVNDKVNISELQQKVRASVRQSIRMSVAAKKQIEQRVEANMKKLDYDLGRKVNEMRGRRDARAYEKLQQASQANANRAKPADEVLVDNSFKQESNNSLFDQNLSMFDQRKDFGQKPPVGQSIAQEAETSDIRLQSDFLTDHLQENERHEPQPDIDPRLMEASAEINALNIDDDCLLNDNDLDHFIQENLDNLQSFDVTNVRFVGGEVEVEGALKIDIPDDLDDEFMRKNSAAQHGAMATPSSASNKYAEKRFLRKTQKGLQGSIKVLASNLAESVMQAQERVKYKDIEQDLSVEGLFKSPSVYQKRDNAPADQTDKLLLLGDTDSGFSSSDNADVTASDEDESQPSFGISERHDGSQDRDQEDSALGLREFIKMQKQNYGKLQFRGTIIKEDDLEQEDDSFEIKREKKKKKEFEQYNSQLESIQRKVEEHTTIQKQKMRESIKQISQLRQRASLLHRKKAQGETATGGSSGATTATQSNSVKASNSPSARKESHKIADKFLIQTDLDDADDHVEARLNQLNDPIDILQDLDKDPFGTQRQKQGGLLANEFDLNMLNEDDLLNEMMEIENQAKLTMDELMREQEEFERIAQRQMKNTMKKIRSSIKSSIRESRATITKRKTQRETIKKLQADASIGTGKKGQLGLNNDKCANCDKYLEIIEQCDKQIDDLQKEVKLLKIQVAK